MAENLNIPPSRFNALSLRRLAERKNVERIFGATAAILATNAVKYLLSLNLVSGWFFYVFGLPPSTYFYNNLRYIIIAILLAGYSLVFYLLHKRLTASVARPRRIFYDAVTAVGLLVIFALNVHFLPHQPDARALIPTKDWSDTIIASQASDGGILEKARDPSYPTQVWTTAQALVGVLADRADLNEPKVAAIKKAFGYIESARHPNPNDGKTEFDEGWGLFEKSQRSTTEIVGWVTLANIASLEPETRIWNSTESPVVVKHVQRDLKLIVARQDDTGGWRPIKESGRDFTRTYSTAIALWSLIEARRSKLVHEAIGNSYDANISKGIDWVLKSYARETIDGTVQNLGWVPNPNRRGQRERFDGLTAQVLYILSRVEDQPGFENLKNDEAYLAHKRTFITDSDLAQRFVYSNDRIHDFDLAFIGGDNTRLDFVLEGSTLLWFPWSYIELASLSNDPSLTPQERSAAAVLRKEILDSKVDDINKFVQAEFMYVLAEHLYCFSMSKKQGQSGNQ